MSSRLLLRTAVSSSNTILSSPVGFMLHSFRLHKGVKLLDPPTDMVRKVPLADVVAHNLVSNERRRRALDAHISDYYWHRRMISGFEIKTILAEIDRPRQKSLYLQTRGQAVLNGASGSRARNLLRKEMNFSEESIEWFRERYGDLVSPFTMGHATTDLRDCWIDAKNYHNFFHFLTESFHLAFSPSLQGRNIRNINFVSKSKRVGDFVEKWIVACNELFEDTFKLKFGINDNTDKPEAVLLPISSEHLLYQFSGDHHRDIERARPAGQTWTGYNATPHPVKIFQLNSFDESLRIFRQQITDLAQSKVRTTWSNRIYVKRSGSLLRKRTMIGEDALTCDLAAHGFDVVSFEDMSPLEQVKCVSAADCIVMQHGAGMANMLFARPTAHIFELGTFQTALARWSDFIQISHVSGCHYHHVCLDMDYPDEESDPVFADDGLIAPVISDKDRTKFISLMKQELQDAKPGTLSGFLRHCKFFMDRGAFAQAYRLQDENAIFFDQTIEYWEQRGMLAQACQHHQRAEEAFKTARALKAKVRSYS